MPFLGLLLLFQIVGVVNCSLNLIVDTKITLRRPMPFLDLLPQFVISYVCVCINFRVFVTPDIFCKPPFLLIRYLR